VVPEVREVGKRLLGGKRIAAEVEKPAAVATK
jgi:hypothetical protein